MVAYFIAEFTLMEGQGAEVVPQWSIHTNRSSNKQARGVGVVLCIPKGDKIECMIRLDFPTTNNEAEYKALIVGLDLAKVAGAKNMIIHYDSQIITSQVNGSYECKNERMKNYLDKVKGRIGNLQIKFIQIPREENECTDRLAKAASVERIIVPNQVLSFVQTSSLIDDSMNVQEIGAESN